MVLFLVTFKLFVLKTQQDALSHNKLVAVDINIENAS